MWHGWSNMSAIMCACHIYQEPFWLYVDFPHHAQQYMLVLIEKNVPNFRLLDIWQYVWATQSEFCDRLREYLVVHHTRYCIESSTLDSPSCDVMDSLNSCSIWNLLRYIRAAPVFVLDTVWTVKNFERLRFVDWYCCIYILCFNR